MKKCPKCELNYITIDDEICRICKAALKTGMPQKIVIASANIPHFTVPANIPGNGQTTAFVLSCPGQLEKSKGKPCAGNTGVIIDKTLEKLMMKRAELFQSSNRYDYPIINSSNRVHYKALGNGTEPDKSELEEQDNITRFENELKRAGANLLIFMRRESTTDMQ